MLSSLWLRDPAMQMASRRLCSSIRSSEAGLGKRCTFWGRLCVADRALDVGELSLREKVRTEVSLKLVFETLQHLAPRQEITFQQEEQYKELRSSGASEPERQWQLRRGGARCRWEVRWDENQQDQQIQTWSTGKPPNQKPGGHDKSWRCLNSRVEK